MIVSGVIAMLSCIATIVIGTVCWEDPNRLRISPIFNLRPMMDDQVFNLLSIAEDGILLLDRILWRSQRLDL